MNLLTSLGLAGLAAAALGLQSQVPSRPVAPAASANPPTNLAWADVDVDGLDDLLAADAAGGLALLRNGGDGRMIDVTEAYGLSGLHGITGAAWADADADGLRDLLLVGADGRAQLWRHHGAFFVDVSAAAGLDRVGGVRSAAWVDYDRDGLVDLVLEGELERALLHHLGGFTFEPVTLPEPARASIVAEATGRPQVADEAVRGKADGERAARDPAARTLTASGPGGASSVGGIDPAPNRTRGGGVLPTLSCALTLTDLSGGPCIPADSLPQLGALYPLSVDFNLDPASGNVGMGTATPAAPLHVTQLDNPMQASALTNEVGLFDATDAVLGVYSLGAGSWGSAFVLGERGPDGGLVDKWGISRLTSGSSSELRFTHGSDSNYSFNPTLMTLTTAGHLGLSAAPGSDHLRVAHSATTGIAARFDSTHPSSSAPALFANHGGAGAALQAATKLGEFAITANGPGGIHCVASDGIGVHAEASSGTPLYVNKTSGTGSAAILSSGGSLWTMLVSNTNAAPKAAYFNGDTEVGYAGGFGLPVVRARLGVDSTKAGYAHFLNDQNEITIAIDANHNGDGRIYTDELVITGGADLVERFAVREAAVEPGTVVVIDAQRPGELCVSTRAYDRAVAGIVSGAGDIQPGLSMGQEGVADGDVPVAMTGRVYVRASAENGAIRPGDRLTTAATPGHAMRVTEGADCDGAVIGKAMGALDEGTGLVLVLVNLQ